MAIKVATGTLTFIGIVAGGWLALGFPTVVMSNDFESNLKPLKEIVGYNLAANQSVISREELDILERLSRRDITTEYRELLKKRLIRVREEKEHNKKRQERLKK